MKTGGVKSGFGVTGILLGAVCVAFISVVEAYGLGSGVSSGSASLYANGTVIMEINNPVIPRLVQLAFFTCFFSILLGIVSVIRREQMIASLGAIAFGVAPILMYLLGIRFTNILYLIVVLPIAVIALFRVIRQ